MIFEKFIFSYVFKFLDPGFHNIVHQNCLSLKTFHFQICLFVPSIIRQYTWYWALYLVFKKTIHICFYHLKCNIFSPLISTPFFNFLYLKANSTILLKVMVQLFIRKYLVLKISLTWNSYFWFFYFNFIQ